MLLAVGFLGGCAGGAKKGAGTTERSPDCLVGGPGANRGGRLVAALLEPVDARHAPVPVNRSEALLFRNLYETLIEVDCRGRVLPGLAESWSGREDGRIWTFTLRRDAHYTDGSLVFSGDIRRSWEAARGRAGFPSPWTWVRPESVSAAGRTVRVALTEGIGNAPTLFCHPDLAIARRSPTRLWALGTGYWSVARSGADEVLLVPNPWSPATQREYPVEWRFLLRPGGDPRDLLGEKVDALLVEDGDALDYASSLSAYRLVPLPPDRLYLLLGAGLENARAGDLRRDLARELAGSAGYSGVKAASAVRFAGAPCKTRRKRPDSGRVATAPKTEGGGGVDSLDADGKSRVYYLEGDPGSRNLAGRLVALSGGDPAPSSLRNPSVFPVPAGRIAATAVSMLGPASVLVLSVPSRFGDSCLESLALQALLAPPFPVATAGASLVVQSDVAGFAVDGNGILLLDRAGRLAPGSLP